MVKTWQVQKQDFSFIYSISFLKDYYYCIDVSERKSCYQDFDALASWKHLYQERCHFVLENALKAPLRVKSKALQGLACKEMDVLLCKIIE